MTTATPPADPPIAVSADSAALPRATVGSRDRLASSIVGTLLEGRNWFRLRLLADCLLLYLAASIALLTPTHNEGAAGHLISGVFPLLVLALAHARPGPDRRHLGSALDTVFHLLGTVSLAAVIAVAGASSLGDPHPVTDTTRLWLFSFVLLATGRLGLIVLRRQALALELLAIPTLIVGAGPVGERLAKRLSTDHRHGLRPVAFLDCDPQAPDQHALSDRLPVLGGPDDIARALSVSGARHVILGFANASDQQLVDQVRECEALGVSVSVVPRLYDAINVRASLDHVGGMPLVSLRPIDPHGWQFAVKHAAGRAIAGLAVLLLTPVLLLIAVTVRLTSPGPVLFRQRRVGRDGHEFDVLKFRSMRVPQPADLSFAPAVGSAPGGVEGHDRRTWIGRILRASSLDELPQLFNVIRGEMTLIGPRPERPEFVAQFIGEVDRYDERHRVKAGITGWAQVNGLRGQTSIAERIECDNYYIENWSLRLDLRIIALTVIEVFRFRDS